MRVVVTDRPFPTQNPYDDFLDETVDIYGDVVDSHGGEIVYADCETESDAVEASRDADVIVTFIVPITDAVMDAAGDVDLIVRQGAGYDNVDVQAATVRGIPVSNAPDYASADVASHGIALALAASHDIVTADRELRENQGWGSSRLIHPLQGGTYGIVGLGRIGRRAVPMARGLNMDVVAYDPMIDADIFSEFGVEAVSFEDLLDQADCIAIHAPLNDVTHHLFSTSEFERMRESAVLVNVARGPIVDESALVTAVESGEIRGAGIDVFEDEPPTDSAVLDCEGIVCSPHHAGSSPSAKRNKIGIVSEELGRVFRGDPLHNVVNPEVYQHREA